jgi:hypothetical protein
LFSDTETVAKIFTPNSDLYYSDLDGAWEFAKLVEKSGPNGKLTEFLELNSEKTLNNSESPNYLVHNRFEWQFEAGDSKPVWLEMSWQPWSSETERGFDQPYLAIFLDQTLIYTANIDEQCCQPQTKQWYLGELSDQQTLTIFAGEAGDLEKPSGLEIQTLRLLTQAEEVAPTPTPTPTPTIVATTQSIVPPTISQTPVQSGVVLGETIETVSETTADPPVWRETIEKVIDDPTINRFAWTQLVLLVMVGIMLIFSLVSLRRHSA